MGKNKIKNLRDIIVDNVNYKWMYDGYIVIWRDKKEIYRGWPEQYKYIDDMQVTPGLIQKIINQKLGVDNPIDNSDLLYRIENEGSCGMDYYNKFVSLVDKKSEQLWMEFNLKYEQLIKHLKNNIKQEEADS